MVQRFEENVARLPTFLGIAAANGDIEINPFWRLRFDALFSRCRLIVLDESLRMTAALRNMKNPSDHTMLVTAGIQDMTITEAKKHVAALELSILACEHKNLKRLEAEARLVQACFYLVLREFGATSDYDVNASLSKIWTLCQSFPDTAGLLMSTYIAVRTVVGGGQRPSNLYKSRDLWWTWPKHVVGSLGHCKSGHPYSSETWCGCPECGREVSKPDPVNPQNFLKEDAFVVAMREQIFDGSRWRN